MPRVVMAVLRPTLGRSAQSARTALTDGMLRGQRCSQFTCIEGAMHVSRLEPPSALLRLKVVHRHRLSAALVGLAFAASSVGCSSVTEGHNAPHPQQGGASRAVATPTLNPWLSGRMATDRQAYVPGDEVEVRWQRRERRGIAYSLDGWTGTDWKTEYYVTAVSQGYPPAAGPTWWDANERRGWVDIGVSGSGPDVAVVPDVADPGTYRLCTANAAKKSCVLLTVEETG
jgi:hypothetical protein